MEKRKKMKVAAGGQPHYAQQVAAFSLVEPKGAIC